MYSVYECIKQGLKLQHFVIQQLAIDRPNDPD